MFIIQPDAAVFTVVKIGESTNCQSSLCEEGHSDVHAKITHEHLSDLKDFIKHTSRKVCKEHRIETLSYFLNTVTSKK